jgi:hypothetical protein
MPGNSRQYVALVSADSATLRRQVVSWLFACSVIGGVVWFACSPDSGPLIISGFVILVLGSQLFHALRTERWMRDPVLVERLARYEAARAATFDDACGAVGKDAMLVDLDRVTTVSLSGFGNQRVAHYRSAPFDVIMRERDGRVRSLEVFVTRWFNR